MSDNIHREKQKGTEVLDKSEDREVVTFFIDPVPKPRMTQRDKWAERPVVTHYFAFCDLMRLFANKNKFEMPASGAHLIFHIPMPKSWSDKKKELMLGKPHQQKPDIDNLEKAVLDALCKDDSYIWDLRKTKVWATAGKIVVIKS